MFRDTPISTQSIGDTICSTGVHFNSLCHSPWNNSSTSPSKSHRRVKSNDPITGSLSRVPSKSLHLCPSKSATEGMTVSLTMSTSILLVASQTGLPSLSFLSKLLLNSPDKSPYGGPTASPYERLWIALLGSPHKQPFSSPNEGRYITSSSPTLSGPSQFLSEYTLGLPVPNLSDLQFVWEFKGEHLTPQMVQRSYWTDPSGGFGVNIVGYSHLKRAISLPWFDDGNTNQSGVYGVKKLMDLKGCLEYNLLESQCFH